MKEFLAAVDVSVKIRENPWRIFSLLRDLRAFVVRYFR